MIEAKNVFYNLKQLSVAAAQYDGKDATPVKALLGDACEVIPSEDKTIVVKAYIKENVVKVMQKGDWAVLFDNAKVVVFPNEAFHCLFEEEVRGNFSFDKALDYLKRGHSVARKKQWENDGEFICKQIPSDLAGVIIEKRQSLPRSAKDMLMDVHGTPEIHYRSQFLKISMITRVATSWIPTGDDLLDDDWILVK